MSGTIIYPINEVERRQVFDIVHLSEDKVWRYIGNLLSDKFNIDGGDQDAIRETIVNNGQFLYHYVMIKLFQAFPNKFHYQQNGPLLYRFIWLEVRPSYSHVLHKGTLWHSSYQSAISDGLKYISSYDFFSEDDPAKPLLSVESLCQCQLPKCPYSSDVFCIDNCTCTNVDWYSMPRPCAVSAGGGCHSQICTVGGDDYKVLVIRLSLELKRPLGNLHVFCIPRTDTYFFSRHKRISQAFRSFTTR